MQNSNAFSTYQKATIFFILLALGLAPTSTGFGQGADLIWSPRHEADQIPVSQCHFRKKFTLINPEKAEIFITADDSFELYINGQLVQSGSEIDTVYQIDISSFLKPGVNLVAMKVENFYGQSAGLAARLRVKERNETRWRSLKTDNSWKTRIDQIADWKSNGYNDIGWLSANVLQAEYLDQNNVAQSVAKPEAQPATDSETQPAVPIVQNTPPIQQGGLPPIRQAKAMVSNDANQQAAPAETQPAAEEAQPAAQKSDYTIAPEFKLQQILSNEQTDSIIAIAFNEFGRLIFSKEGGPLMIANLTLPSDDPAYIQTLCDEVTSCQGILPLNGDVYVTGDGPSGLGLYRLSGKTNQSLTIKSTLLKFKGEPSEHGPHGLELGPDGMIYCVVGNGSSIENPSAPTSPFKHTHEGDLVKRYEDPSGHAAGVRGDGGTIVRVAIDGSKIEKVAGGIRNAYDLVFDQWGDLYIHDSDMESDIGMSWYRPTSISRVVPGSDLGWRSGWAKFPEYFTDTIPPLAKTGRGSPTGAVCYQHVQFPSRYHQSLIFADWSEGRILAALPQSQGTSTEFKIEELLSGKPLNVTDMAVGEDGAIYFSTGGRGTSGGLYRIFWGGTIPQSMMNFESELAKVIRHPQPNSAWARQNIAKLQRKLADTWNDDILGIAKETRNQSEFRTRALDIMVIYGPFPSPEFLANLSKDRDPRVRAKVASLCGMREGYSSILNELIQDQDPNVKRQVCQSFLRLGEQPKAADLLTILSSSNRFDTVAARRLLGQIPSTKWLEQVLKTDNKRTFINGSLVAVTSQPSLDTSYQVLARCSEIMNEYVSDADFVDLLRVMQLALIQGKVDPKNVPAFVEQIQKEFPTGNGLLNRELARILAYLKAGNFDNRIISYFETTTDTKEDRVHVAMFLQTIGKDLSDSARLAIINQLEEAKSYNNGGSYRLYLTKAIKEVANTISEEQVSELLKNGDRWPTAVISAFYRLPQQLSVEQIAAITELDQKLKTKTENGPAQQARLGVIAILAQCGNESCMNYLRQLWQQETERRGDIAIGLAQQPDGKNWPYLVSSLPALDDMSGIEVLTKLTQVDLRPKNASFYKHVLQLGYRLENEGALRSAQLIEHWSGESVEGELGNWKATLNYWKKWYETKFPEGPAVEVPNIQKVGRYSVKQVSNSVNQSIGEGNPERGHLLFKNAKCADCHRFGAFGDSMGPDLTSVASRFSQRELIESIIDPSKVISDQYKTQTILTQGGQQVTGMLVRESDGYVVLQSDGKKVQVSDAEVDQIKQDKTSAMPEGLLDDLSMEEVRDLIAYIYSSNPERLAQEPATTR